MPGAPYLSCYNLSVSYGSTQLFKNISFSVHPGERWGIVGPNGAGKSTLFKMIIGEKTPDSGSVSIRNGICISIVSQKYGFDGDLSVDEIVRQSLPEEYDLDLQIRKIEKEIEIHSLIAEHKENFADELWLDKLAFLNDKLASMQGVGTDNIIQSTLKAGNLLSIRLKKFKELSGGQQKRVQIISALLKRPQLILLDEPTNHLDVQTVDWLEEFLLEVVEQGPSLFGFKSNNNEASNEAVSFVIISHDRALLDTLVNKILEIDGGESKQYDGNYESYSQEKLENELVEEKNRSKMANLMRRELAWLRTGAKARTTKQKSRIDRALLLDKTLSIKEQKLAQIKKAEITFDAQMLDEERNASDSIISVIRNLGEQELVSLREVDILHPAFLEAEKNFVFKNLNFVIKPKIRIALLGPNGCGKSTLMNLIADHMKPHAGNVIYHELTTISHFDQHRYNLDLNNTVRKTIAPEGDYVHFGGKYMHIMSYLERFLFFKFDANRSVKDLSGGEQARLLLAKLMLEQSNLLILDEPTNDLDIPTLQVLERNLFDFQGGVLFTSHDRYFVQRVATSMLSFLGEKKKGDMLISEWIMLPDLDQALDQMEKFKDENNTINKKENKIINLEIDQNQLSIKNKKLSFKEQKELNTLEKRIFELENLLIILTKKLDDFYANGKAYIETQALCKEIKNYQNELDHSYNRWNELS